VRRRAAVALAALLAAALAVVALGLASGRDGSDPGPAGTSRDAAPDARANRPGPAGGLRWESEQLNDGPLPLRRVSFATAGRRATGLLAVPPGQRAPMPAVLYLHGYLAASDDWVPEMLFMAARGVVTLSIDAADVGLPPHPGDGLPGLREDLRRRLATRARILRAAALLAARRDVDPERIAFAGFSRGAAVGALAMGALPDLAAELYVAGSAGTATWPGRLAGLDDAERAQAQRLIARIDPARALRRLASRRPRLVQYGTRDEVVPVAALRTFAAAVPRPREVTVRPLPHALDLRALHERLEWLDRALAVEGPPVQGAPALLKRR
jgi:dienelactone hydrolase